MELHKNIFCNTDKLVEGSTVTLRYTGSLCDSVADSDIYIHYGFGPNWENTSELKMIKTDFGYEANVELIGSYVFNCCFRDGNNKWDNNNSQNYCFEIELPFEEEISSNVSDIDNEFASSEETSLQIVNDGWINRLATLFKKIASYVPKIVSGTWKRKKTSEN